jgi:hypothetical protein
MLLLELKSGKNNSPSPGGQAGGKENSLSYLRDGQSLGSTQTFIG